MSPGPQSGLIVEVPEGEPAVGRHRARLDASARLGVAAQITHADLARPALMHAG
jgi:hypothetical protein